jgi:hypothetical protein
MVPDIPSAPPVLRLSLLASRREKVLSVVTVVGTLAIALLTLYYQFLDTPVSGSPTTSPTSRGPVGSPTT